MKKSFYISNKAFLSLVLLVSFIAGFAFYTKDANSLRGLGIGYFTGNSYSGVGNKLLRGGSGSADDGIPGWVNTKAELISFINSKHTSGNNNDKIGADYIIQTMRGKDASGNFDYGRPNANDIADWAAKLNDASVVYSNSEARSYTINSRTEPGGVDSGVRDVVRYSESGTRASIVLRVNGVIVYELKRDCGNPLGNLPGIPVLNKDYTLAPAVSLSTNTIEAGSSFGVTPSVTNSGTTVSDSATYKLAKTITNPDANGATTTGTGTFASKSTTNVLGYTETSTDYTPGTHMCFVLSVTPHSDTDSGTISSSPPVCVLIGKKPKTQVWGGDLLVGGNTDTSTSTKSGKTFGSWVEYAIFAVGNIKGTASGAAFAQVGITTSAGSSFACNYSKLSFANALSTSTNYATATCTGATDTIGHYSNALNVPDVAARFPTSVSTPIVPTNPSISSMSGLYKYTDPNLTISGGTIPPNKWVVINAPNTDITIATNINYDNTATLHNLSDIPQVVIIAKSITINASVTHVDSWLIAKNGNIYTCDIDPKTVNDCKDQLVVNGPVIANKLFLRRTYGSGSGGASGDPGEIFNLRADAYLWGYSLSAGDGKIQTVHTTELPPRL